MEHRVIDGTVVLVCHETGISTGELLRRAAAAATDTDATTLDVEHRCVRCGSTDHGRPVVFGTSGQPLGCSVSASRASGITVTAASTRGQVGIDVESIEAIARHPVDDSLLHPRESMLLASLDPVERDRARALLWTCKEAVTKSLGVGLNLDLRQLEIALDAQAAQAQLVAWPAALERASTPTLRTFTLDDDVVGAIALWS